MSDYIPTGDGWIAGPPAVDAGPVEVVRYAVASPAAETDADAATAEQVWHRPLPGLPTTPGFYLAGDAVIELLTAPAGQWADAGDQNLADEQVRALGPLQRLITAAELLEQVRQGITALGALDGDAKAAVYNSLDGIEDDYGVNG